MKSSSTYLKLFTIPILVFGSFLFLAFSVHAEEITDFSVDINVKQNSSVEVEEVIAYDFGDAERHGIYRDIPVAYTTKLGNQLDIDLKILNISDFNGNPYQYSTSRQGNNLQIKIGDPNKTISGKHIYKINYQVKEVVNFFTDHDELYWNVTGNDWPVSIQYTQARVRLEGQVNPQDLQTACFSGQTGSQYQNCTHKVADNTMLFFSQDIAPQEGLTIVAGWPKGVVIEPSFWQKVLWFIIANPIIFLPILTFIILCIIWYKVGRDEPGRVTIIAQYQPPHN